MDVNDVFPSRYLKPRDLAGRLVVVTIARAALELVGKDERLVLVLEGKTKTLVLNKTNARAVAEIAHSSETDDWPGVRIELFTTPVEYRGRVVDGLPVRAPGGERPRPVAARLPRLSVIGRRN